MADTSSVWPYLQKQTLIKIRRYAAKQCNSIKEFTREGVKLQSRWNFPEIELSFFSSSGQFQSSTKNDQKKIAFKILSCKQLQTEKFCMNSYGWKSNEMTEESCSNSTMRSVGGRKRKWEALLARRTRHSLTLQSDDAEAKTRSPSFSSFPIPVDKNRP